MDERRRAQRLEEENEITITIVSGGEKPPKEKIIYNYSKDISVSGARIQAHIFLPVDSLLRIEMTLKTLRQMIIVLGKVKWIKVIFEDESYEAGVELLTEYISWKQKFKSLNKGDRRI
jgi:hypothetical protein